MATRPVPLWKNSDYILLWLGQSVSVFGTYVSQLAFPLLVLALTGSPAQAGFVAAARSLPWLLFALPAGALVDRWDRKLVMIVCGLGSALALASIPVAYTFGSLTIAQIVIVSFVEGTLAIIFGLAETSALPQVIAKEQLPAAIAQQQAQYAVGALLGPPLGGALYGFGRMLPFIVDAASYAASACSLRFVRAKFGNQETVVRRSPRAEIGEGVGWLWNQPLVRFMAFLTGSLNFVAGLNLIIIVIVQRQGASPAAIGVMFAVAGIGGLLGAIGAPQLQRRLSFGQAIIAIVWLQAVIFALFAVAPSVVAVAALLTLFYLIGPAYDTVQFSYRLALIPERLLGRVNGVFRLIAQGMRPFGVALTGILIERIDVAATLFFLSGWLLVSAVVTTLNRHVREAPAFADAVAA